MNKFFIIEVPPHEMKKRFTHAPTSGFYFCKTDDRKDITQFINDRFGTINKIYEFFIHEVTIKQIEDNHLCLFPVFYGHVLDVDIEDIEIEE